MKKTTAANAPSILMSATKGGSACLCTTELEGWKAFVPLSLRSTELDGWKAYDTH